MTPTTTWCHGCVSRERRYTVATQALSDTADIAVAHRNRTWAVGVNAGGDMPVDGVVRMVNGERDAGGASLSGMWSGHLALARGLAAAPAVSGKGRRCVGYGMNAEVGRIASNGKPRPRCAAAHGRGGDATVGIAAAHRHAVRPLRERLWRVSATRGRATRAFWRLRATGCGHRINPKGRSSAG